MVGLTTALVGALLNLEFLILDSLESQGGKRLNFKNQKPPPIYKSEVPHFTSWAVCCLGLAP